MSEFKFACPVCGQHITADSSTTGGQVECPTCFQKIVVPQAPASADTKFILSAAQVAKPRPTSPDTAPLLGPLQGSPRRTSLPVVAMLLVLLCAAGAALYHFRARIFKVPPAPAPVVTNAPPAQPATPGPLNTTYSIPTNFNWTLELTNAVFPNAPVAGKIHGSGFRSEKAVLVRGLLLFGQGKAPYYDLGFGVSLIATQSVELSGKTVEITPDQPNAPRLGWRWRDELDYAETRIISNGYLLKVTFGQATNGHMPGKVYMCLPDEDKSFAAGTFNAEIKNPLQPKPAPRKTPRRKN